MIVILKFIHLLSLVIWVGGIIFFSFIAAPSIFKVLPRETAGDVVGDIFPKYWMMGYICSITALVTIIALSFLGRTYPWVRIGLLVLMVGMTFYSGLAVGAKAREVKAQIHTTEDPAKKEMLRAEFKTMHKRSAILNGIILAFGLVVIFIMVY
ncbi:MAG: DUF4149 domain-containing protein [Deltaproteobacteria bacterium]|nr:DUF4149 domain-containing protein [Deltaproteobacteria bacterium]